MTAFHLVLSFFGISLLAEDTNAMHNTKSKTLIEEYIIVCDKIKELNEKLEKAVAKNDEVKQKIIRDELSHVRKKWQPLNRKLKQIVNKERQKRE